MKQYLVTKKIQTWDCKKYEIYKLNDKQTWYVSTSDSQCGYSVDDIHNLRNNYHWFFDGITDAQRKLSLIEYNNSSYCNILYRVPEFFALEEPKDGSFICECGTHLIMREYGETTNDDGVPLDDGVVIRGACLCGKVHTFDRKVEVVINVKYEKRQ